MRNLGKYKYVAIVAIVFLGIAGIRSYGQPAAKVQGNKAVAVSVQKAAEKMVPLTLDAVGTAQPVNSVTVIPQVTGRITAVYYEPGQEVEAGQVLAQIDPAPFQQQLNQAEAQLEAARRNDTYNTDTAARYGELYQQGAVSRQEYEKQSSTAGVQDATVRQLEAAVENARISLNHAQITAPVSGRTGAIGANVGAMVTANQTQIVVINQMNPIYVQFTIPEASLSQVSAAQAAQPIQATVREAEKGNVLAVGKVTFIDNTIDRTSGTIGLKAEFSNDGLKLWPGQFLQVLLQLGEPKKRLVIPAAAVMDGQKGKYVFIVQDDHTVAIRPVEVSGVSGDLAVISKGVSIGDTVVTDGQLNLKDGSAVSVKPAVSASPSEGDGA